MHYKQKIKYMHPKLSTINYKEVGLVLLPLLIFGKIFSFKPLVENTFFNKIIIILHISFFLFCLPTIFRKASPHFKIFHAVRNVIFVLCGAPFVGILIHNQHFYSGFSFISVSLSICMFFWLLRFRISSQSVMQAIFIYTLLLVLIQSLCFLTFPNHIFGYNEQLIANSEQSMEARGTIRFHLPGQDLIACLIFYLITQKNKLKQNLPLIIILFIILTLRGTRFPLFVTFLICTIYITYHIKYRFIALISSFILTIPFITTIAFEHILKSDTNNIIIKYIQITNKQLFESDEEDVRMRMAKYYLTQFNDTPLQVLIGNGVPGAGTEYDKKMKYNKEYRSFFISDVGYIQIYIIYGLIGIGVYLSLLYKTLKTHISHQYKFAKLFVLYYFISGLTGAYLLSNALYMSLALYLIEINRLKTNKLLHTNQLYNS